MGRSNRCDMMSLRYHPLFADDVLEAAGWYETQNPTLGNTFVEHVAEAVRLAIQNPERRAPGLLRVIDESEEDYLFPATCFVPVEVPKAAARLFSKRSA